MCIFVVHGNIYLFERKNGISELKEKTNIYFQNTKQIKFETFIVLSLMRQKKKREDYLKIIKQTNKDQFYD